MPRMRFAILTLGSRGDVQPYVALGRELIQRGHQVIICTGQSFENFIQENGIAFARAESDLMAMLQTEEGQAVFHGGLGNFKKAMDYAKQVVNPAFRKTLDDFWNCAQGADCILYHPKALGAPDMALALGIPCVSIPPVPITVAVDEFPNLALAPQQNLGRFLNRLSYKISALAEASSIKEVNDFREKTLGLAPRKAGRYSEYLEEQRIPVIYPLSTHLFPDVHSWENKVFLSGFFFLPFSQPLSGEIEDFLANGAPPVVITFSSMPLQHPDKVSMEIVKAVESTKRRVILLTGKNGFPLQHKEILVAEQAPHLPLFARSAGVVHHGGVGTMAAALAAGAVQQLVPFSVDQPFWSHRLARLGLTPKPLREKDLLAANLAASFEKLQHASYRQKAKEMAEKLRHENGVQTASQYLENIVHAYKK